MGYAPQADRIFHRLVSGVCCYEYHASCRGIPADGNDVRRIVAPHRLRARGAAAALGDACRFRGPFLLHRSAIRVAGANGGQAADAPAYGCRGWWTAEFAAADATRSCRHRAD